MLAMAMVDMAAITLDTTLGTALDTMMDMATMLAMGTTVDTMAAMVTMDMDTMAVTAAAMAMADILIRAMEAPIRGLSTATISLPRVMVTKAPIQLLKLVLGIDFLICCSYLWLNFQYCRCKSVCQAPRLSVVIDYCSQICEIKF